MQFVLTLKMSSNKVWRGTFCRLLTYCWERKVSQQCNISRHLLRDPHLRQLRHLRTSVRLCKDPDRDQPADVTSGKEEADKPKLENLSVNTDKHDNLSVVEAKAEHLAVTEAKIEELSLTEAKTENLAVTEAKTENVSVTEAKEEHLAVTAAKVEDLSVTEAKTEHLAVTEAKVENLAVTEAKIQDLSVAEVKVENLAVTEAKTEDLSIAEAKTENLAVTEAKTEDLSVAEAKTENLSVAEDKTENLSVAENKTENLSVAENKIDHLSVAEDKIDNLSVAENKTENLSVAEDKIDHLSVAEDKINNLSVADDKIENLAVAEDKIDNLSVAENKIENTNAADGSSSDSSSSSSDSDGSSSSDSDSDSDVEIVLDSKVTAAASDVAASLPGDKRSTMSDLLAKLKSQAKLTIDQQQGIAPKKSTKHYSELYKTVEFKGKLAAKDEGTGTEWKRRKEWVVFVRNLAPHTTQRRLRNVFEAAGAIKVYVAPEAKRHKAEGFGLIAFETEEAARNAIQKYDQTEIDGCKVKLTYDLKNDPAREVGGDTEKFKSSGIFDGTPVGIFSKSDVGKSEVVPVESLGLYEVVQAEDADTSCLYPPRNGFEEMIQWTKQGKLWTFPIDNELGSEEKKKVVFHEHMFLDHLLDKYPKHSPVCWEEEQNVGFHEHVFLDHLLDDFPRHGPVRSFMDLVTTSLAQNPYLTIEQKHDTVYWYRDYFNEKQAVLKDHLGEDGLMAAARNAS